MRAILAQAFVQARGDLTKTAEIAKCSYDYAQQTIQKPGMNQLIAQAQRQIAAPALTAAGITAQRVMLELGRVAFADVRKLYDHTGNLLPIHMLDDDTAAAVSNMQIEIAGRGGDGTGRGDGDPADCTPVVTKRVKTADKMAALGILARHFKLVGDEGDGVSALASALADRLNSARRRLGEPEPQPVEDVPYTEPTNADGFPDELA